MTDMTDLTDRADIVRLVDAFYGRVRADAILSPIFDGIARVDWTLHLPKMYDFWESVLFGRAGSVRRSSSDTVGGDRAPSIASVLRQATRS